MLSNKQLLETIQEIITDGRWDWIVKDGDDPAHLASELLRGAFPNDYDRLPTLQEVRMKLNLISIDYYDQSWDTIFSTADNEYALYVVGIALEEEG